MSDDNEIIVKLTALGDSFEQGLKNAAGAWQGLLKELVGGNAAFGAAMTSIVGVGAALFAIVERTAHFEAELAKMSEKTGMSVEDLSLFKYAAEQSDTSLQSLTTSVKFMARHLTDAAAGNEQARVSFQALGVDWQKLLDMPVKERFLTLVDAIQKVNDPSLRAGLAMRIFGRNAEEMLPLINQGSAGIEALMAKAKELGLQISGDNSKQAKEFEDSLKTLWELLKKLGLEVGDMLIPLFKKLTEWLVILVQAIKGGVVLALDILVTSFYSLVLAASYAQLGIAKITDMLHLTKGEYEAVNKQTEFYKILTIELAKKTAESFNNILNIATGTANAQEKTNTGTRESINLTDKQRLAILNEKQALENLIKTKEAMGRYDDEYFDAYTRLLEKQGMTNEQIGNMIIAKHAEIRKKSIEEANAFLDHYMGVKRRAQEFDDEYFNAYKQKLENMGATEKQIAQAVLEEHRRVRSKDYQEAVRYDTLYATAVQTIANNIQKIWSDTGMSFRDVWKIALESFIRITALMLINWEITQSGMRTASEITTAEIETDKAIMTEGLSLIITMIALIFFSGNKGGKSTIQQAAEQFLDALKTSLRQFESQIVDTLTRLTFKTGDLREDFNLLMASYQQLPHMNLEDVFAAMGNLQSTIKERYELEKSLINDVIDLLKKQKNFITDIDKSITDVIRSSYTEPQLLAAQKQDIQSIITQIIGATGQDKIDLAGDLKDAYLTYFDTAKNMFSGPELAAIQREVISGLQATKEYGKSGYDQLIDINLSMLGVQREGNDLQRQMNALLIFQQNNMLDIFALLKAMALINSGQSASALTILQQFGITDLNYGVWQKIVLKLTELLQNLDPSLQVQSWGIENAYPQFATGGYVTKSTLAMIGEGNEPEWVLPESKLQRFLELAGGGGGFSGAHTVNVYFTGGIDMKNFTTSQAEVLLKTTFRQAMENLGRRGYTLPITARG